MEYSVVLIAFCFFASSKALPTPRMVGGVEVQIEQFPAVAAVLELPEGFSVYQHICGGAILTSFYILTAAQCVSNRPLRVRVGSTSRSSGGTIHQVILTVIHPEYQTRAADIAVLGLDTPILFNSPTVGQAPLPFQDMEATVGMTAFVVGWSADEPSGEPSESLEAGILSVVDREQCAGAHAGLPNSTKVTAYHMCASSPGVDFCSGGHGSPLFSAGVAVGIAVHTLDCGVTGVPSVYTGVSRYTNWILSVASGDPSG